MLHFYDRATFAHALTLDLPALVRDRINALREDLIDWTEYLVIEAGDTEQDIIRHLGFSPLHNATDDIRYGEHDFEPSWDWLADRGGWFEMVVTFGSTFAFILFIEDIEGVDPGLRAMCCIYCGGRA